jgi:hypothetical protein
MLDDARRLREMPRARLSEDFTGQVLAAIGSNAVSIPSQVAKTAQQYLPMWANLAAAAAVMLAVSVGTYLVVALNDQQHQTQKVAERPATNSSEKTLSQPNITQPQPDVTVQHTTKPEPEAIEKAPYPREEVVASVPMSEPTESPEIPSQSALTAPFSPRLNLFKAEMPKLPPILGVRELNQSMQRSVFRDVVQAEDACHIDLFCKDANRGFERVQMALRACGKRTIVEALAQQRLQAHLKTSFVFFTESMTPDEIARLFDLLAVEENKSEARQMEKVVVTALSPSSQKTLATLLGIDPKQLNLKTKSTAAPDPQKPISDATADKVARALAEKEKAAGAPARNVDNLAIALSYNPVRPTPGLSKEVREFINQHKERRPGTVALMLVIRNLD